MNNNSNKIYLWGREFEWMQEPKSFAIDCNQIVVTAEKNTNLFNSPSGYFKSHQFPFLYMEYEGDFVCRCRVCPEFHSTYDLGSIVVWADENTWIKFAYELTDCGYPAMVSVVTKDFSDDCNGPAVKGEIMMQISRKGDVFALHYSMDNVNWQLLRICRVQMKNKVKLGVSVQCPSGEECSAGFKDFSVLEYTYENQRQAK